MLNGSRLLRFFIVPPYIGLNMSLISWQSCLLILRLKSANEVMYKQKIASFHVGILTASRVFYFNMLKM